jgi:Na+/phosphate symporter
MVDFSTASKNQFLKIRRLKTHFQRLLDRAGSAKNTEVSKNHLCSNVQITNTTLLIFLSKYFSKSCLVLYYHHDKEDSEEPLYLSS